MWRKLPLSIKLLSSLFLVQAISLGAGALWLTHWVDKNFKEELKSRLDTLSDVIEDLVQTYDGGLSVKVKGEVAKELDLDRNTFFLILGKNDEIVFESHGPNEEIRDSLRRAVQKDSSKAEEIYEAALTTGRWLMQTERISKAHGGRNIDGIAVVAVNAQPAINEDALIKRNVWLAGAGILILTSLGTGLVVSLSTRNLRKFAVQLKEVRPPRFETRDELRAQSAEEKLLFESYAQLMGLVRAAMESQRLFIAHASHELKSPVAASMAAMEVLLSRPRSIKDYHETCVDVLGEIKVLNRLTAALLDLARLDEEFERSENANKCSVADVVSGSFDRWQKFCSDFKVTLRFDIATAENVLVPGTYEQWAVIIGNLIENAAKYGVPGGYVAVDLRDKNDGKLQISVVDNGIGMSAQDISRLGELFFRVDLSRTNNGSFGLGFAHVKRLTQQLGCEIDVSSGDQGGLCVVIKAPTM